MASKKGQLVCQHLEGASAKLFEKYADILRDYVRARHGVYALYKKDRLYYVGLATNLRSRLKQHLRDRHRRRWDRFSVYLVINHLYIKELETLVVRMVRPKGNKQLGRFAASENLKSRLAKDLRRQQSEEIATLLGKKRRTRTAPRRVRRAPSDGEGVLASYLTKGIRIRAQYNGRTVLARVHKNGWIRYGDYLYKHPSGAGVAVRKNRTNGWKFWHYQRSPGEWVPLDELRR